MRPFNSPTIWQSRSTDTVSDTYISTYSNTGMVESELEIG